VCDMASEFVRSDGQITRCVSLLVMLAFWAAADAAAQNARFTTGPVLAADEAVQAVAVWHGSVYAISNSRIGRYDVETGERLALWEGPLTHLNSGIVIDDTLYAAHSNYPGVPMVSSIEMFDPETLTHLGSHALGIGHGSATWIDRRRGMWWVGFANYDGRGGTPGRSTEWTNIVVYDRHFRRVGGWVYPEEVTSRFEGRSNSGAAFGPDDRLYASGHDATEVYVMEIPDLGATLRLAEIIPFPGEGQGVAWDVSKDMLWGLKRSERVLVGARIHR